MSFMLPDLDLCLSLCSLTRPMTFFYSLSSLAYKPADSTSCIHRTATCIGFYPQTPTEDFICLWCFFVFCFFCFLSFVFLLVLNQFLELYRRSIDCFSSGLLRALSPFPLLCLLIITFWMQRSLSLLLTCLGLKRLCTSPQVSHYGHILSFQEISFLGSVQLILPFSFLLTIEA